MYYGFDVPPVEFNEKTWPEPEASFLLNSCGSLRSLARGTHACRPRTSNGALLQKTEISREKR
jgi:hypothetical protein